MASTAGTSGQATFFISSQTRQTVKRPAVGAEGWVLNHYDTAALQAHFKAVGEPMLKAGTTGLRIFGLRELEYAATPLNPGFIVPHAYSTAEYLLTSGKRLADGETIGVGGEKRFSISHADTGDFIAFQIARLTFEPRTT